MSSRKKSGRRQGSGGRVEKTRVRSARGRRLSSTLWLKRQLNDPYVQAAQRDGYRSRAAYKIVELDEKFGLIKRGMKIVDLGAAPGGWTQVAVHKIGDAGYVLALDINPMDPVAGAEVMLGDINDAATAAEIRTRLEGGADLVLSDMAPPSSGHQSTDHVRIVGLVEAAFLLAQEVLNPGGAFVAKVWQGGADGELLTQLRKCFVSVKHAKPKSSRSSSAEMYLVAEGFRANLSKTDASE